VLRNRSEAHSRVWSFAALTFRAVSAGAVGALIGVLIGTGTALAQPHVGQPWSALVNSSSPWLLGGFIAGALHRKRGPAALAGLATLLVAVAAYFAITDMLHIPVLRDYILFWAACAVAGGPVAGYAGWAWRWGGPGAQGFGAAFLPGSFIAEAFGAYGLRLHYEPGLTMFLLIGALLFALLAWPGTGLGLIAAPARGTVMVAWTAAFCVAGILIYGPLLNAVVGVYSGGVYFPSYP
jgi:Family of unknown function (DUF6518)